VGNWSANLSTWFVAAVATLLIWTWAADRTRETRELKGTISFRSSDPKQHFVDPMKPFVVTLLVKASPASIDRIQTLLDETLLIPSGTAGFPSTTGSYNVMLADALNNVQQIIATDATILTSRPESAKVVIGDLTSTQFPLVAKISLAEYESASINPAVVVVTLPTLAMEAMKNLQVEAVVDTKDLSTGKNNAPATLRLPESVGVKPDQVSFFPNEVNVTFTLRRKRDNINLATVPLQIAASPTDLKGFDITFQQDGGVLRDVVLIGPADALKDIETGKFAVAAIVPLNSGDLGSKVAKKAISNWILPTGVSVESVAGKQIVNLEIALKIEPRATVTIVPDAEVEPPLPAPKGP